MHFSKTLAWIILWMSASVNVFSQEEITAAELDQKTYRLYENKNWNELIGLADSMINAGIDYYYLRVRLGVAYFETKKYRKAENEFRKALDFNSFEDFPKSYLYYCYLFNGKMEESKTLARKFPTSLKKQIGFDTLKTIDLWSVEYGRKLTAFDIPNAGFFQAGLNHYVGNRFSLYHAYSNYTQKGDIFENKQNQYFLGFTLPLKNNYKLSGGFHYLYNDFYVNYLRRSLTGNNLVGALSLKKSTAYFDFSLGSTIMNLDSLNQFQHEAGVNFFPLASSKFNIGANLISYTRDNYVTTYLAVVPYVAFKPTWRWNLTANFLWNNQGYNLSEWNGYFVNNTLDITKNRSTATIGYHLNKKWELVFTYQNENKQTVNTGTLKENYQFNSYFFGLKYKP